MESFRQYHLANKLEIKEKIIMGKLEGKVAFITVASRGIGAALAKRFIVEGAKVILTDLQEDTGSTLASSLGKDAIFVRHDVTKAEDWAQAIQEGEAAFGPITVLVNNAGILGPVIKTADVSEVDISINQIAVVLGMKVVIPSMVKAGGGSIVNIYSAAGIAAINGAPSLAHVASKIAVRGMTKQTAVEYGSKIIRVNSVHSSFIDTTMIVEATDSEDGEATSLIPLGRIAKLEEVTNLVLFLASDES